jgi:hypothetical protein
MTPEQIQDIVMGTIAAAMDTGDLVGPGGPVSREMPEMQPEMGGMPPDMGGMPPQMPPGGPMQ